MMIGQAAGVAASLAISGHTSIQEISISDLQKKLRAQQAILHLSEDFHGGAE
jgi:hypothetical protein